MAANRFYRALGALLRTEERADPSLSLDQWASFFSFNGLQYPFMTAGTTTGGNRESITHSFTAYVQMAYRANGPVFACMVFRAAIFSQAHFQFQRYQNGKPTELFGTQELNILETPWSGGTTADLLARAMQDNDLAGNFFCVRRNKELRRLRPDWVTIVAGTNDVYDTEASLDDLDTQLAGYLYHPGGPNGGQKPISLLPEEVCHFAPNPDPLFRFRGMSWVEPIVREIMGDSAATSHKLAFFDNAATPQMLISLDPATTKASFDAYKEEMKKGHEGLANAYKTLLLVGATATPLGLSFRQMDFKVTQGAGESRIASAAQIPPILVGFSEGLASGTYSNYAQAVRRFGDGTMRPLWDNFAGSMQRVIAVPPGADLMVDTRNIAFLRADQQDEATIRSTDAATIASLVNAGFKPDEVITAVMGGDLATLKGQHTGWFSVQLQRPGEPAKSSGDAVPLQVGDEKPKSNGTLPDAAKGGVAVGTKK